MPGGDTLYLEILTGISCQLKHLSGEIFEDSGAVNCSSCSNTAMAGCAIFQVSVDTAHRKLQTPM